jgi:hypothetical protein
MGWSGAQTILQDAGFLCHFEDMLMAGNVDILCPMDKLVQKDGLLVGEEHEDDELVCIYIHSSLQSLICLGLQIPGPSKDTTNQSEPAAQPIAYEDLEPDIEDIVDDNPSKESSHTHKQSELFVSIDSKQVYKASVLCLYSHPHTCAFCLRLGFICFFF